MAFFFLSLSLFCFFGVDLTGLGWQGFIPELMTMIKMSEEAPVAKAGLWALSSICRGLPGGAVLFLSHDGFTAIGHCLKMGNSALNDKVTL